MSDESPYGRASAFCVEDSARAHRLLSALPFFSFVSAPPGRDCKRCLVSASDPELLPSALRFASRALRNCCLALAVANGAGRSARSESSSLCPGRDKYLREPHDAPCCTALPIADRLLEATPDSIPSVRPNNNTSGNVQQGRNFKSCPGEILQVCGAPGGQSSRTNRAPGAGHCTRYFHRCPTSLCLSRGETLHFAVSKAAGPTSG